MKTFIALFLASSANAQSSGKSSKAESLSYSFAGFDFAKSGKSGGRNLIHIDELDFSGKSSKAESLSYSFAGFDFAKSGKSGGRNLINIDEVESRDLHSADMSYRMFVPSAKALKHLDDAKSGKGQANEDEDLSYSFEDFDYGKSGKAGGRLLGKSSKDESLSYSFVDIAEAKSGKSSRFLINIDGIESRNLHEADMSYRMFAVPIAKSFKSKSAKAEEDEEMSFPMLSAKSLKFIADDDGSSSNGSKSAAPDEIPSKAAKVSVESHGYPTSSKGSKAEPKVHSIFDLAGYADTSSKSSKSEHVFGRFLDVVLDDSMSYTNVIVAGKSAKLQPKSGKSFAIDDGAEASSRDSFGSEGNSSFKAGKASSSAESKSSSKAGKTSANDSTKSESQSSSKAGKSDAKIDVRSIDPTSTKLNAIDFTKMATPEIEPNTAEESAAVQLAQGLFTTCFLVASYFVF